MVFFGGMTTPAGIMSGPSNGVHEHLGAYRLHTTTGADLSLPADYSTIAAPAAP
jgi:hypothetical protein